MRRGAWVLLVLWFPGVAEAAIVCTVKQAGTRTEAVITRPGKASEFYALVEKNLLAEAARCCVACVIGIATSVIVTKGGVFSQTIRVLDGPYKGCIGDISTDQLICR